MLFDIRKQSMDGKQGFLFVQQAMVFAFASTEEEQVVFGFIASKYVCLFVVIVYMQLPWNGKKTFWRFWCIGLLSWFIVFLRLRQGVW